VRPVRIMGHDLVLFRDEAGALGLLDRHCTHRGADLAFGRLEDGGLRCLFHGWLFDRNGRCLETPAEPEGRSLCTRVTQRSYPVIERNGIIFAYLGPGRARCLRGARLLYGARQPRFRIQRLPGLQLAAGFGSRSRSSARELPTTVSLKTRMRPGATADSFARPLRIARCR